MRRVLVFDRFDAQVCELAENDVFELTRHEVVNGEHELSITTTQVLEKGWRVVMQDDRGYWHEWVVSGIDDTHANGSRPYGSYYCVWSVQPDLMGTRVSAMPGVQTPVTAAQALDAVLSGTSRWTRGTITNTNTGGASMYDTDGWSAMSTLVANWGGEVDTTISVSSSGVVSRQVDLYSQQGESTAKRRFDFGADLVSVRRTIADDPLYCRITPRGKGEETEGGGYGRKITIESVNGGKDYLVNSAMVDLAKLPDGNGGWEYPTLEVENSECETPSELLAWSQGVLESYTTPKVTYEVNVIQAAMEGVDFHGVSLGDSVQIVDGKFNDLRLTGRVMEITTDELTHTATSLTIGSITEGISSRFSDLYDGIRTAELSVTQLSESLATSDYIDDLLTRINAEVNATGGYAYIVPGNGILTFDVAVADPLNPVEASRVVEIKGGTIRIANSKTAQGQWEWKTVFTSGHIAADLVTAAQLTTGYIGNASGTYWDLDNNLLHLPATTIMDDTNLGAVLDKVDATITGVDVQYAQNQSGTTAPTSGWSTTAPEWREGYYIWQRTATTTPNGTTYSTPVMISGRDGEDGSSVTILGSYNTLAELQAAHPTGNTGDGYIVGNDLYVWNGTAWEDVGAIRGPQGPAGADGENGSQIWTATSDPTTPNYTFPISSLTGSSNVTPRIGDLIVRSYYRYTITSVGSTSVLAGVRTSIRGAAGANGTSVSIQSTSKVGDTTTVVLTDGTTTSTLSIVDGADGVNGTPGASGYVHIAWATSEDGSEGFSTTDSEGKTYIGVYTDHTQADSTNYQDYSWSLIQGMGVSEIAEQYYLSTSNVTQSGGSWLANQPAWETDKFIWTRSMITWTDGTISYTEPVLAQAINGANELADEALSEAAKANAMIRAYGAGVLVCRQGNTVGALVNADGSFDVVNVTWSGTTPTAGNAIATFGSSVVIGESSKSRVELNSSEIKIAYVTSVGAERTAMKVTANETTIGYRLAGSTVGQNSTILTGATATASGYGSTAIGGRGTASGRYSLTINDNNTASAECATAMGYKTQASGTYSIAAGSNTIASGMSSVAIGNYNVANTGHRLIVGKGSSDSSRSNAMYLTTAGALWIAGTLTQNSDRRIKQHVAYLGDDANVIINRLKPAVFIKDGGRHYGFYAQDVQRADIWDTKTVEAQHTDESLDFDPLTMDYSALIAPLTAYAQNLEKRIEELERRLADL